MSSTRLKRSLVLVSLLTVSLIMFMEVRGGGDTCNDSSEPTRSTPTRLRDGKQGRVTLSGGANNVREEPNPDAPKIGTLQPGSTFTVLISFSCTENALWLKVDNGAGLVGWTVEIIDGIYALEPIPVSGAPTGTPRPAPTLPPPVISSIPEPSIFGAGSVDYQGIHFDVDGNLASGIEASFVLGEEFSAAVLPSALIFHLTKDIDGTSQHVGFVRILSAQDFTNHYLTSVIHLRNALATSADHHPAIPGNMMQFISTAGLAFNVHNQLIPFNGGQMLRRLAIYTSDGLFLPNYLIYEAHGLSNDGFYYVQASFITTYNDLSVFDPPTSDRTDPNLPSLLEMFHNRVRETLTNAADESFSPNPRQIDALLASLTIAPGTLGELIAQANVQATALAPQEEILLTQQVIKQATAYAGATATVQARCGNLESLLQVGDTAMQVLGSSSLRVRETPAGEVLAGINLFPGDTVLIIGGPKCIDNTVWWQIEPTNDTWQGWVAESKDQYYLGRTTAP